MAVGASIIASLVTVILFILGLAYFDFFRRKREEHELAKAAIEAAAAQKAQEVKEEPAPPPTPSYRDDLHDSPTGTYLILDSNGITAAVITHVGIDVRGNRPYNRYDVLTAKGLKKQVRVDDLPEVKYARTIPVFGEWSLEVPVEYRYLEALCSKIRNYMTVALHYEYRSPLLYCIPHGANVSDIVVDFLPSDSWGERGGSVILQSDHAKAVTPSSIRPLEDVIKDAIKDYRTFLDGTRDRSEALFGHHGIDVCSMTKNSVHGYGEDADRAIKYLEWFIEAPLGDDPEVIITDKD